MKKSTDRKGIVSLRAMAGIAAIVLLPVVLYAGAPAWWTSRHVTSGTASDYAGANQGQLKNMATAAFNELSANLPGGVGDMTAPSGTFPGGTGYQLTALINSWSTTTGGTQVEVTGSNTSDYAGVNIGQAKGVSRLFYKRLIEAGFASQYPWEGTGNPRNDYAGANIGQIKNLFSFDVTTDSGTDGVPDMWEMNWFGSIGMSGTSLAPSGSGLTILQCYEGGLNPFDYYEGVSPTLTIISGTNQTGTPGAMLSSPLVVQVTGTSGSPLVNAPVTFTVTQGAGALAPDNSGTSETSGMLQALTGTNGYAQVWLQQPFDANFTTTVSAYAEASVVNFNEVTTSDTNAPVAPSDVAATVQFAGNVQVEWQDNSDNETGFTIQRSDDGGATWITVGTVGADAISFLVAASDAGTAGSSLFQVMATSSSVNTASVAPATSTGTPKSLPIVHYVAVDISSGSDAHSSSTVVHSGTDIAALPSDVISMALGDNNQASYCYMSGTYSTPGSWTASGTTSWNIEDSITVNTWTSGTTASNAILTGTTQTYIQTGSNSLGNSQSPGAYFNSLSAPSLTPAGNAYGTMIQTVWIGWLGADPDPFDWSPNYITNPYSWVSGTLQINPFNSGTFTTSLSDLYTNNHLLGTQSDVWSGSSGLAGVNVWGCSPTGGGYFGYGSFACTGTYTLANTFYGSFVVTSSGTKMFYDTTIANNNTLKSNIPGTLTATGTGFYPTAMNDGGAAIGKGTDSISSYYWNGTGLTLLGTNATAAGLNNQNMVISTTTNSGTQTGMLWLMNSSTSMTMQSIVTASLDKYEVQSSLPLAISGTNNDGRVSILCSGSVMESTGDTDVHLHPLYQLKPENLVFNVNAATPSGTTAPNIPLISIAKLPSGINFQSNKSINANGILSGIGAISYTGTDGSNHTTKEKAMLLVPIQYRQISPNSGFDFLSDPNWLMVAVGGSNQVKVITPATSSFNMNFSIQSGTTTPATLALTPGSTSDSPQTITVTSSGTGIGKVSQVQIGVGTARTSGTNGAGLGIDVKRAKVINIVIHAVTQTGTSVLEPMRTPSASVLQDYLNQLYGPQANVTFNVKRVDLAGSYDLDKNNDLDIKQLANEQSSEEVALTANYNFNFAYNIYYVQSFKSLDGPDAGTHDIYGIAKYGATRIQNGKTVSIPYAIIEDCPVGIDELHVAAHEIGHLLSLLHTNLFFNPAFHPGTWDSYRLMYPYVLSATEKPSENTQSLLIQPEWDIINQIP